MNKAKGFRVEVLDVVTNTVNTFDSLREAAKQLKISRETLIKNDKMKLEKGIDILIRKRYSPTYGGLPPLFDGSTILTKSGGNKKIDLGKFND